MDRRREQALRLSKRSEDITGSQREIAGAGVRIRLQLRAEPTPRS